MDTLDRATLIELARYRGFPAVTITMPTHKAGPEREQDPIRMKKLLKRAEEGLIAEGVRSPEAESLLAEARALLDDARAWQNGASGVAVFAEPGSTRILRLKAPVAAQVAVGDRFYLRPLMPAAERSMPFYILAVSGNSARLFAADLNSIEPVELPERTPTSLADALKYDVAEESLQLQTRSAPSSGRNGGSIAQFHGHGGARDARGEQLRQYLIALERGVREAIAENGDRALLLAGVADILALYREVNRYPNVLAEQVVGNPDELDAARLHAKALEALEDRIHEEAAGAVEELTEREAVSLATRDVTQIVPAAASGRVGLLLTSDSVGPFGRYDESSMTAEVVAPAADRFLRDSKAAGEDAMPTRSAWDLVDIAIAETLLHGGEVVAFTGEEAPVREAAAILRY